MSTIYVYVMDTLADWELGYVTAELNSGRFFKEGAPKVTLKTVSHSKEPVTTMGGMRIVPDCVIADIEVAEANVLLFRNYRESQRVSFNRCYGGSHLRSNSCTCKFWVIG